MTERVSERSIFGRRFSTGHEILDEIFTINHGSTILMLDQTFTEAKNLLYMIFEHYGKVKLPIEITSRRPTIVHERLVDLGDLSLSDVSISVNNARQRFSGEPIIHSYLPDLIIRNAPEDVLKFVESWQRNVNESDTVEFYLLPIGAFTDLEKKMLAIVDGAVEIRTMPTETGFTLTFSPIRICKPEWHLKPFQYRIDGERLLIKWEGEFTDKLPKISPEEIKSRMDGFRKELQLLRIRRGYKPPTGLSVTDYALYSALENRDLLSISVAFPDKFEEVLRKIAKWHIEGLVSIEKLDQPVLEVGKLNVGKKISFKTKLGLRVPPGLASLLFRTRTGGVRKMPVDLYLASRRASILLMSLQLEENEPRLTQSIRQMLELEKRLGEAAARDTVVGQVQMMGEDVTASVDQKFIPTVMRLMFGAAYGLSSEITKKSEKEYLITVKDCFICQDIKYSRPACALIEGNIEGVAAMMIKKKVTCEEIACKTLNDPECVFRLRVS